MSNDTEIARIANHYAKRTAVYSPLSGWVFRTRAERELMYARIVRNRFGTDISSLKFLEIGSGYGDNLMFFARLGIAPDNMAGVELLGDRVERSRELLPPGACVVHGDASNLPFPDESQDIVFQSLVFSSILDVDLSRAVAEEMWRVTKTDGIIIWYDFTYSNPQNPDVRGVSKGDVRNLFPEADIEFRRVTLAPPISRVLCRFSDSLYVFGNVLPFLRTHIIARITKR